MTISANSGRPEIGRQDPDVPCTLAAHRGRLLSQKDLNSDRNFQNLIKEADIYKKY